MHIFSYIGNGSGSAGGKGGGVSPSGEDSGSLLVLQDHLYI